MGVFTLESLRYPIVQAPLAGGASTPALAAAVANAGGLGFLAAGYKSAQAVRTDLDQLRELLSQGARFGINIFSPPQRGAAVDDINNYADSLRAEAQRAGVVLGAPRWDDDHYAEKLELVCREHVPVVSFTFGCPSSREIGQLHDSGAAVWVTVTTAEEAATATAAGADALVVQGTEAGGHRGGFDDSDPEQYGLIALLQLVRARVGAAVPLVATGGIATGSGVAAVLAAGAAAAALGTVFLLCPEASTAPVHRTAITDGARPTALTRAFTGRTARGLANRFLQDHSAAAPSAYPEIHHLTAPLRAAARGRGDADTLHLWAGQAYALAQPLPAAELVIQLADGARAALAGAAARLGAGVAQASATEPAPSKPN